MLTANLAASPARIDDSPEQFSVVKTTAISNCCFENVLAKEGPVFGLETVDECPPRASRFKEGSWADCARRKETTSRKFSSIVEPFSVSPYRRTRKGESRRQTSASQTHASSQAASEQTLPLKQMSPRKQPRRNQNPKKARRLPSRERAEKEELEDAHHKAN